MDHEGLLGCVVAVLHHPVAEVNHPVAEVYHLIEGVFVGEVRIGDTATPGGRWWRHNHNGASRLRLCRYALLTFIRQTPPFIKIIL